MKTINLEQLKQIQAKLLLDLSLNSFEEAYYTLYGEHLTEEK